MKNNTILQYIKKGLKIFVIIFIVLVLINFVFINLIIDKSRTHIRDSKFYYLNGDIVLSPDGNYIALPTIWNVYIWNIQSGELIPLPESANYPFQSKIDFSYDSRLLNFNKNKIFNITNRAFFKLPDNFGSFIGFTYSGELVFFCKSDSSCTTLTDKDRDSKLIFYNMDTQKYIIKKVKKLEEYCSGMTELEFLALPSDNNWLVLISDIFTQSESIKFKIYSVEQDDVVKTIEIPYKKAPKHRMKNICFIKDRAFIFGDKEVRIIDLLEEKMKSITYAQEIKTSDGDNAPFCVSNDGEWFAVQYPKDVSMSEPCSEVAVYSTSTGTIISKILLKDHFSMPRDSVIYMALDSKKRILAVGNDPDRKRYSQEKLYDQVTIYDIDSKKPIRTFTTVPMNGSK